MKKPGANDKCPCDSGLKYKKRRLNRPLPSSEPQKLFKSKKQARIKSDMGIEGVEILVTALPRNTNDASHPMNRSKPGGSSGDYEVEFVLSKPGEDPLPEDHIVFGQLEDKGDSHLLVGERLNDKVRFDFNVNGKEYSCVGFANSRGRV